MLCNVFKLKSRLRLATTVLVGLMFIISAASATAHCLESPAGMQPGASDNGQPGHELQKNDQDGAHHGVKEHSHNPPKKKGGSSASVCAGSGMALVAQCKVELGLRLVESPFAAIAQAPLSLSVPPPSEPPRI